MPEEIRPEPEPEETESNNNIPEAGQPGTPGRRRRRVRKRIRIKKKPGVKRKVKKILEKAIWIIVIGGFIITLIIMMKQLDVTDENAKAKKKKSFLKEIPAYHFFKVT